MTPIEIQALALSASVAAVTVLLCFLPALWASSWAGRLGPRGRWVLDAGLLLPLALSPAVVGWAVVVLVAPPWLNGGASLAPWLQGMAAWLPGGFRLVPEGLVLVNVVFTLPLMVRTMRPAFEAIDHGTVLTARTLGASRWVAWWTVTAAQAAPAMVSALALGFAAAWGECGASVVMMAALQAPTLSAHGAPAATVPLTLMSALQTQHGQAVAWRLSMVSLGVALLAMLLSEWTRLRWRQRALPTGARGVAA